MNSLISVLQKPVQFTVDEVWFKTNDLVLVPTIADKRIRILKLSTDKSRSIRVMIKIKFNSPKIDGSRHLKSLRPGPC